MINILLSVQMEMKTITYEEMIHLLNKETEDGYHLWTFKEILNHHVWKKNGNSFMEVKVLWDTKEQT